MNDKQTFTIADPSAFKLKMLNWCSRFNIFAFLDSCGYQHAQVPYDYILAAGASSSINISGKDAFSQLASFYDNDPSWLFGHISYELKKDKNEADGFNNGFFFVPDILIFVTGNEVVIHHNAEKAKAIFDQVVNSSSKIKSSTLKIDVISRIDRDNYIDKIKAIKDHIQRGDCYEINFCQLFYAENVDCDPLDTFIRLQQASPNPFSAFYRNDDNYCMCASPERFLKKEGTKIISQPIKGTAARHPDPEKDNEAKEILLSSKKERSENVMIVDLVRNDLSRVCMEGSVHVEELFGIYSFPQVHQMISTIAGEVDDSVHWSTVIDVAFPMGSMTGAPKKKVMELIEKYEIFPRGLFSGSIGYVSPKGNFDFNVVIRSIFFNTKTQRLHFMAGGGITANSDPQSEYEESLLKAKAILKVLNG